MAEPTVIGRSTFVRGRVTGNGDLEIAGRVEGEIAATGDVLVDTSGLVGADITGRRIVVRGAVRGNLTADEAVVLESGARVVGDLRAPRVAIAPGGLVRGYVQTAAGGAARPAVRTTSASAPRTAPVARTVAPVPASRVQPAPAKAAPAPTPATVASKPANGATKLGLPRAAGAGKQGPPPPVVPVLKKGTKAVQKKRG